MNYTFRSSLRKIVFCAAFGVACSRILVVMVGGNVTPVTVANYIGHGVLAGAFFMLAEKIYHRLFKDVDPDRKMVFVQKYGNEN